MAITLPKDIEEVTKYIGELPSFSKLEIEYYAVENGAADVIAKKLGDKMKVNQLRKLFESIKGIERDCRGKDDSDKFETDKLYRILPELAYALGRGLITSDFYELVKTGIGNSNTTKFKTVGDFLRFKDFLSAIIAYNKKHQKGKGE
ncbi:MAG: type III-A CRISPR-associated protein Csm2 [bacterium]